MTDGPPPDHDRPVEDYTVEPADEVKVETGSMAMTPTVIQSIDRAQIDSQVATAKMYPRNVTDALSKARSMACLTKETAATMLYAVKRGGKILEGPSVRMAEVIASTWKNLRIDAQVVDEGPTMLTAMSTCFDLENNVAIRVQVKRRITDKNGRRYNDDMIMTTGNAAISIALRNSVFRVVPRALVDGVYQEARKASLGKGATLTQLRQATLEWFGKVGVTPEQVFQLVEIRGLDDMMEEHIITLRGLAESIKRGEQKVELLFAPDTEPSQAAVNLNDALRAKAAGNRGGEEKPGEQQAPPAPPAPKKGAANDLDALEGGKRK